MPKRRVVRHEVVQPLGESYRFIPLTQGQTAIVDVSDFDFLSQWNWHAWRDLRTNKFYALANKPKGVISMQRVILGCGPKEEGDHIDGNTLDNRRSNLRKCTKAQNGRNRGKNIKNTSGYKGVFWHARNCKWRAQIMVDRKSIHLGLFHSREAAAIAYNEAARFYFKEFAVLNPIATKDR